MRPEKILMICHKSGVLVPGGEVGAKIERWPHKTEFISIAYF